MEKSDKAKSALRNRRHVGSTYSITNRTHPCKTLLPREHDEWQRSKIKATTRDSGVFSRTAASEELTEVNNNNGTHKCFNFSEANYSFYEKCCSIVEDRLLIGFSDFYLLHFLSWSNIIILAFFGFFEVSHNFFFFFQFK